MKKLLLFGVVLAMIFATACGGVALPEEGITTTAGEEASRPADTAPAEGDTRLLRLAVNGVSLPDFDPDKTAYTVSAEDVDSMDVEAVAAQEGAVISVAREGASVTVTVTGKNGENQRVYTLDARVALEGKVVNHNGANATVTYVIDDGDQQTAIAVIKNMAEKYPSLAASFALVTQSLATFKTVEGADGVLEYLKDENGNYVYSKNTANWNFWDKMLHRYGRDGFEAVSHSHTHKYWGENDEGGAFDFRLSNKKTVTSEIFPRGNVSKEFLGSNQIIRELGQRGLVFVRPGLTHEGQGVKLSSGFWDNMQNSGAFIARGTYTYPDQPETMLNSFTAFGDADARFFLKSYMVQHYNTSPGVKTEKGKSTPEECLAAGIDYWTDYIDTAVENNAWAAFCIHTIRPDTHTGSGHYIFNSQADALFAYTEQLSAENKVWVANLTDAFLYAIEWSTASVEAHQVGNDRAVVSLSCRETAEIYRLPLTVRILLPAGKTAASLNGSALVTEEAEGLTYAYLNLIPGSEVTLDLQ